MLIALLLLARPFVARPIVARLLLLLGLVTLFVAPAGLAILRPWLIGLARTRLISRWSRSFISGLVSFRGLVIVWLTRLVWFTRPRIGLPLLWRLLVRRAGLPVAWPVRALPVPTRLI